MKTDTLYIDGDTLDKEANFNIDLEIDSYEESDSNSIKVKLNLKFEGMTIFDSEGSELCIVNGRAIVEAKANKVVFDHRNFYGMTECDIDEFGLRRTETLLKMSFIKLLNWSSKHSIDV